MATHLIENKLASHSSKARGFCETEQKWCGDWQDAVALAEADCKKHVAKPGNGKHITSVTIKSETTIRLA